LHHLSKSVGWNCSNIAAYPTVPVVCMLPPLIDEHPAGTLYGLYGRRLSPMGPRILVVDALLQPLG
jgi:hypothetical protein